MNDMDKRFEELVEHFTEPTSPPAIRADLSFPEYVPRLHEDLGVAGSLKQRLARLPKRRDRFWVMGAGVAFVLLGLLLAALAFQGHEWGGGFGTLLVVAGAATVYVGHTRLRELRTEALRAQIKAEEELISTLESSLPDTWHVLPDRLLPGTETRLPAILVGPRGIVLVQLALDGPYRETAEGWVGPNDSNADRLVEEFWDCMLQMMHTIETHEQFTFTEAAGQPIAFSGLLIESRPGAQVQTLPRSWVTPEDSEILTRLPRQAAGTISGMGTLCLSGRQAESIVDYFAVHAPPAPHTSEGRAS